MNCHLLWEIIDKYERGEDWRGLTSGNRSLSFEKNALYEKYGKSSLVEEAVYWQEKGLIRIKWLYYKSDLERVFYQLECIPRMYELTGRVPKLEKLTKARTYVSGQMAQVERAWIRDYYREILDQLEKGNWPEELDHCGQGSAYAEGHLQAGGEDYVNLLFKCLNDLDQLHNPVYKKIFSRYSLKGSKVFEKKLQRRVLTIARNHCGDVDENMNDSQALSQLYIEEYSQELSVKGDLVVLQDGASLDLSPFRYGMVLNSEMLKHVTVPSGQKIRNVITVENKANYMSMPYEPETLIIFSHGYFSPKERDFLKELEERLRGRDVSFFHTGDLDYGGVCIFRYIREQIFPKLQPWQMDEVQYERYIDEAVQMEETSWEKLKKVEEPLLQPLIARILDEKKVIEQESFLAPFADNRETDR